MTMRYSFLMFMIIAIAIGVGFVFYNITNKASQKADFHIAVFAPAVHPAMDEIEEGFKDSLKKGKKSYAFDTYNANGNKTLLRAQSEEIIQRRYDLIFTIGTLCSHTIYTLTEKKGITTSVVFTAIDNLVKLGLVKSLENSGNHLTGTMIRDDFDGQFDSLLNVKPDTKHVLFVYDPGDGAGRDDICTEIARTIQKREIQFSCIQVFQANEIQQKVMPFIEQTDVVFIYTDHTTVSGIDSLIVLCNRYGKTLFASDLNSADKGAALAYGVREYDHGIQAGKKAQKILEHHKAPSEIFITPVLEQRLKINLTTMKRQGLNLSQHDLEQIQSRGGIIK